MFKNEYPIFVKKHLLKIEMLENLRDFPRDVLNIFYQDYCDGILTGCELQVKNQWLVIKPGIIVFQKRLYLLREAVPIRYEAHDCWMFLKLKISDEHKTVDKISYLTQLVLDGQPSNQKDELELCRFWLQEGHQLRDDYQNFADFATTYDTLNRIHVPYASVRESTIWPKLLRYYTEAMMKQGQLTSADISFGMGVLKEDGVVPRAMIVMYLNQCLHQEKQHYTNEEIYHSLLALLQSGKQNYDSNVKDKGKQREILLM